MPGLQPFWLTSDLQQLEIGGTQIGSLGASVQTVFDGLSKPMRDTSRKTAEMAKRLKTWYDAQLEEATAPVTDLATALASFLDDTWTAGIHLFVPYPDFGGMAYLKDVFSGALARSDDPARPLFSDGMYTGGIVLLLAGGPIPVFTGIATLVSLLGGNGNAIMRSLGDVLAASPPMVDVSNAFNQLTSLPAVAWSDATKDLKGWWETSAIGKVATRGFPGSLFEDLSQPPTPVEPPDAIEGQSTQFTLRGSFPTGMILTYNSVVLRPDSQTNGEIVVSVPGRLLKPGQGSFTGYLLGTDGSSLDPRPLAQIAVAGSNPFDPLGGQDERSVFDRWVALSTGSAVNGLFPGVQGMVAAAVNGLANTGSLVEEAGDAIATGLTATAQAAIETLDRVASATDTLGPVVGALVNDLGEMSAATLFIPPTQGGLHQLNFGLSQGLSPFALNAPSVDDEAVVAGIFLAAGAPTSAEVLDTLKRFGAAFGIPSLANLTAQ